jgi:hypothetical protein
MYPYVCQLGIDYCYFMLYGALHKLLIERPMTTHYLFHTISTSEEGERVDMEHMSFPTFDGCLQRAYEAQKAGSEIFNVVSVDLESGKEVTIFGRHEVLTLFRNWRREDANVLFFERLRAA